MGGFKGHYLQLVVSAAEINGIESVLTVELVEKAKMVGCKRVTQVR